MSNCGGKCFNWSGEYTVFNHLNFTIMVQKDCSGQNRWHIKLYMMKTDHINVQSGNLNTKYHCLDTPMFVTCLMHS